MKILQDGWTREIPALENVQRCGKCKRLGHVADRCEFTTDSDDKFLGICATCGRGGHTDAECYNQYDVTGAPIIKCQRCNRQGHIADLCVYKEHIDGNFLGKCSECQRFGHTVKNCDRKDNNDILDPPYDYYSYYQRPPTRDDRNYPKTHINPWVKKGFEERGRRRERSPRKAFVKKFK